MADYQSVAPTTLALTLAEAKAHLRVTTDSDDDLITGHIKAATRFLEMRFNNAFVSQTRVLKADDFDDRRYVRGRRIYPPIYPLRSVSSIAYLTSTGGSTTLPTSDYVVSTGDQPGYIAEAYNATWPSVYPQPNSVTVTYVCGHSTSAANVPEEIKQALRMLVAHYYRNAEAAMEGPVSKEIAYGVDALLESHMVETYG